ncbi:MULTISPECIES: nicotinate-nucleotide--dimethylbenzimidazole phosphoribosyltransferase [unclassified Thioalkalivibrio]|uniref:nicotinate-nucleotide--dimethylbenzimidazole phosphoribosyltransferase n=1 Tax=unclassified Thioalkalivibrio TaxID=2621013 RepID=UPI000366B288|nr:MULTISPECIES: nicotinate-nucleotide--dimethylbenzimidazole phosphoribosyltransferase [unclassified Thioalkalivibrio]
MTEDCDWLNVPAAPLDAGAAARARARQERLTKPPGSLGRLETLAERLAALQGRECPNPPHPWITVFAGDHGVVAEGISRFPQAVTGQMVANFAAGGAAIAVLARSLDAGLEIIDLGTLPGGPEPEGVIRAGLGPGTANFAREPAMTPAQLERALNTGRQAAERACQGGAGLFIGGEMGIGNTTAAAAVACGVLGASPDALAGPGTGLDPAGVRHKAEVIERALALHAEAGDSALEWLRRVGGFEIAGLTGAFLASAQIGQPVLVDGFIASTAALVATRLCPGAGDWFFYAHRSAEPGHDRVLEALGAQPLLDLGMRLGEGSGAATAVPLLRMACELHAGMATFDEAGVADDESGAGA